ncbi:hypothetical protein SSX86_020488 [Deinandra increscens subsp. villosa]|uniref:Uncharacterized protein n=1 Tax=Deinandra increscens subsp. villosa TaxID=3103831 RepID=A0AAP0CV14_9ASTR
MNFIQTLKHPTYIINLLTSKSIQSSSLPLQSINNIHGRHRLPPSVLSVGHSVTNNILQKDLQDATCLFIDQPADPLHSASPRQPPDRRLRDSLNVIPENFPVALCSSLSQPLSTLSAARHRKIRVLTEQIMVRDRGFWRERC